MKQKNPKYELEKREYESLYSAYMGLLSNPSYGRVHSETIEMYNRQNKQYQKWKSTPEYIKIDV